MKIHHPFTGRFLLAVLMIASFATCENDPYKNPDPPSQQKTPQEPREPQRSFLPLSSCSRQEDPPASGGGGGGASGPGCSSRHGTPPQNPPASPRHQREQQQGRRQNEDGPVFPCPDHIFPFCTDENPFGITYKSGVKGYAAFPRASKIGCLGIAPCPTWFYMKIDQPGDLLIYIEQKGLLGKLDVDFACWGPFEANSKRDFLNKLCSNQYKLNVQEHTNHRPLNGDHRGDMGGYPLGNLVDCSFDRAGTEWCYIPAAKSGEWYLLLLTNYSRKKGTIHFNRVDKFSTATTDCKVVVPIKLNPLPKNLRRIDDHTTAICLYEDKALVSVELEMEDDYTLPKGSLRQCRVEVNANGKSYRASLVKDHFECEIDILSDTTEYSVSISCPDPEFYLDTETYRIVRSTDCDPDLVQFTEGDPFYAGDLTLEELVEGKTPVVVDFSDQEGILASLPGHPHINIENYDITVDYDDLFISEVDVDKRDNTVELTPRIKGKWCDCFVPDTVTVWLRMVPNNGDISAFPYEDAIRIGVKHKTVWIGRCLWVLLLMGAIILFILYLLALLKKKRFKKDATVTPVYYNRYGEEIDDGAGQRLRRPGLFAWFSRWFLPGAERCGLSFSNPNCGFTFIAAESPEMVEIPKKCINPSTAEVEGYDPENDMAPSLPVRLGPGGRIGIHQPNGRQEGYLYFRPGDRNDGGVFRLLLGILLIASILVFGALCYFLLRGLF